MYSFAEFILDPIALTLSRDGEPLAVTHKALQLLLCLLEKRGRVLSKDELMREVWPDAFVEEGNLAQHVSTLRKVFGERPGERRFIATVSGQGYAFVGSVTSYDPEFSAAPRSGATVAPRVAVVPFATPASGELCYEWVNLLSQQFAAALSRLPGIQVLPVNASDTCIQANWSDSLTTQSPGTQYVVRGQLTSHSDKVALGVQVIDVKTEAHVLTDTSDWRTEAEQSEMLGHAVAVAHRILAAIRVFESLRRGAGTAPRKAQQAYDFFIRGRYHQHTGQPEGLIKAIGYYQRAVATEPLHAGAYAGISDCYNILITIGRLRFSDYSERMIAAAQRALEIDESFPEAHVSLAAISELNYDWPAAEFRYMRGLSLDPNNAQAHRWYGEYLIRMGRFGEALSELQVARDLDPLARSANAVLGLGLSFSNRFEEAEEQFEYTLEMDPLYNRVYILLAMSRLRRGDPMSALAALQKAPEPDNEVLGWLGYLFGILDKRHEASAILEQLQHPGAEYVPAFSIASVALGLNEVDRAFEWLDRAYAERAFQLGFLQVDRLFESIRNDARFHSLLRKTNLNGVPVRDCPTRY